MRKLLAFGIVFVCLSLNAAAQTEADLKKYFEGRHVILKIDMPATKEGVNIHPERDQPLKYDDYASSLKEYGTAIRRGEQIMITKVKVKGKHIEFQLGGGGYGTAGDESGSPVPARQADKTHREKDLEAKIKTESDEGNKRRLRNELDDLRRRRERENSRNEALAAEANETRRERVAQKALQGGSRFNVHYNSMDLRVQTPQSLMDALAKYVDFTEVD